MDWISVYYVVLLGMSVVFTCIYVFLWHKHFSVNFSLTFAFIPIVNLGYVVFASAKSLEAALIGQKMIYIGGCFLILFITFYVFDMCRIIIPRWLNTGMIAVAMVIYFFVLSAGYSKWFYVSVEAEMVGDRLVLIKEYGPVHTVFQVMVVLLFIIGISAIIYTYKKKHDVSRRILWILMIPEAVTVVAFFFNRIVSFPVEFTPAGYVIAQILYLMVAHIICLYDVSDTAIDSITETGDVGFISFRKNLIYLGSDDTAKEVFDELGELTVDRGLELSDKLTELFKPWIEAFEEDETKDKYHYKKGETIYLVDINRLYHNKKDVGYQLVISDDTKNQQYIELLDNYNADLTEEVKNKTQDIIKMHNSLIRGMAKLVESRDNSTGGHIIRTSDIIEIFLDEIMKDEQFVRENNITEKFRDNLIKAAPLHDIGKIAVDDAILRKPGRFTDEEFEQMKKHAPEGAKVLKVILSDTKDEDFKLLAENVAHYHHERMDGSGYPDGLKGEDIPLEARIMAVVDVYDALVSKRVYKDSMSFEKANEIMMDSMGRHFDKRLEKFYIASRQRFEKYYLEAAAEQADV